MSDESETLYHIGLLDVIATVFTSGLWVLWIILCNEVEAVPVPDEGDAA